MKLQLKYLIPYLPYKVKGKSRNTGTVFTITGFNDRNSITTYGDLGMSDFEGTQLLLHPLSNLLEKLDFFEIGDDNNYSIEFDHWNIKLIQHLKTIAENNDFFDIQFLPYVVVQQLLEWHFDIFNLIGKSLAVDINSIEKQI